MPSFQIGDEILISIDRLSIGGHGVGRFDGIVVFVGDTAPQEKVLARIKEIKKNFAVADLIEIVERSPNRVSPQCPYVPACGGCSWQHLMYEEQLRQKKQIVQDSLKRIAGFQNSTVQNVIPSPKPFRYRNRVQLHHENGHLGFHKRQSHELVDVRDCLITDELITSQFQNLRERLSRKKSSKNSRIEISLSEKGQVTFSNEDRYDDDIGFAQVNSAQNTGLVEFIVSQARQFLDSPPRKALDLYAGSGNFTFPLASAFPATDWVAVELHAKSVKFGQERVRQWASLTSVEFVCSKVEKYLSSQLSQAVDLIILDPPRSGAGENVMSKIAQIKPKLLIYISCHPATLARDLGYLTAPGYKLSVVQPFDMFPQTDHVETVVVAKLEEKI